MKSTERMQRLALLLTMFASLIVLPLWPEALEDNSRLVPGRDIADLSSGELSIVVPEDVAPGEILRVVASGEPSVHEVELRREDGSTVATAQPIEVRTTDAATVRVFLFGIDSRAAPGKHTLNARSESDDVLLARELMIRERRFRSEDIALNSALSSLRGDYDPRKVEESRLLTDLILSRDPEALHNPGPLAWPLPEDTRRTSFFGDRRTFLYSGGERASSIHAGLDLAAPVGTPVYSSGAGVVRMARSRIVTGGTVVIEHLPGVYSLYYHLDEISVDEGVDIDIGELIGTVGATGLATGPHLHWEIRVAGVPVSPEDVTKQALLFGTSAP
ncbi:MAG: M23 family metallopeptidase [Spirochaetota bacterium]